LSLAAACGTVRVRKSSGIKCGAVLAWASRLCQHRR
jgi:hypothetical protein